MSQSLRSQKPAKVPSWDGRSAESRLRRRVKNELTRHVGGHPSVTQTVLIDRAAWLTLYIEKMDQSALATGGLHSERSAQIYLSYQNSLSRALAQLGMDAPPEPKQTHAEWVASLTAQQPATALTQPAKRGGVA